MPSAQKYSNATTDGTTSGGHELGSGATGGVELVVLVGFVELVTFNAEGAMDGARLILGARVSVVFVALAGTAVPFVELEGGGGTPSMVSSVPSGSVSLDGGNGSVRFVALTGRPVLLVEFVAFMACGCRVGVFVRSAAATLLWSLVACALLGARGRETKNDWVWIEKRISCSPTVRSSNDENNGYGFESIYVVNAPIVVVIQSMSVGH